MYRYSTTKSYLKRLHNTVYDCAYEIFNYNYLMYAVTLHEIQICSSKSVDILRHIFRNLWKYNLTTNGDLQETLPPIPRL